MPIVETFSNREAAKQHVADVWIYDQIPHRLLVQISNIVKRAFGFAGDTYDDKFTSQHDYKAIARTLAHEHGIRSLSGQSSAFTDVHMLLGTGGNILLWLDCVELCFRLIRNTRGNYNQHEREMSQITITADDAVEELNQRFRRAGFGYRFEDGQIMRIDNEFTHQQLTRPALELLRDTRFAGANDEFRAAHDHFRAGEFKDCAVDALNALESTMKTICEIRGWDYSKGARATDLIKILRRQGLFPDFADQSFDQLIATLKSGLPVLRNEVGGHGQGTEPVSVPEYVASYALNLSAAKIRFLIEASLAISAESDATQTP